MVAYASALVLLTSTGVILGWLTRGETAEKLTSLNARLPLWELAWTTVTTSNPLFGLGIGASRSVFYDETGLGGAHNALLNVFVDLGVIGVLLWGWIIGVSVWVVVHRAAQSDAELVERALWLSTMTVLVVNGATSAGRGGVASVGVGWLFVLVGRAAQMDRERRGPISARADSPLMRQAQAGPGDRTGP
jgi:O-antigen ligase